MSTSQDTVAAATGSDRRPWWVALLIFATSAAMMMMSARGDLAIDEIVSLNNALKVHSWIGIFTEDQNDNNHLLNTFFMRAFGEQWHLFVYRIPAVIFGAGLLALLMKTSLRLGKTLPMWVACLAGFSFPMVLYSSEARGYVSAMFFAVLAYEILQHCWERFTMPRLILFWAALVMGVVSHFSFIMVCLALGIWSVAHDLMAKVSARTTVLNAVKYYGLPLVFIIAVYLSFVRHMFIYGGPIQTRWQAISDAALYLLGFVANDGLRILGVVLMLALLVYGMGSLFKQGRGEWIFFLAVLFVAPAVMIVVWQPKYLYFRYFSVGFPFFYLLLAYVFAQWFEKGGKLRLFAVALVIAITLGHLIKIGGLLRYGRGNYRQALLEMAAATAGPVIKISSDHDFRNGTLIAFYSRFVPPAKTVEYITHEQRAKEMPEWVIQHCLDPTYPAYNYVIVGNIGRYDLFGVYPFCGLSGWSWFVYHWPGNTAPAAAQAPQPAMANNNAAR